MFPCSSLDSMKEKVMQAQNTKRFYRYGREYVAYYHENGGGLRRLWNKTTGKDIPPETKTFRRLANGNRGRKLTPAA